MSFQPSRSLALALLSLTACTASAPSASTPAAFTPPAQTVVLAPEPARPLAPRPAPTSLASEDVVSLCDRADERMKSVGATLRQARQINPTRPEAYYNEALWLEQLALSQRCDPKASVPILEQSDRLLTWFIELSGDDPAMAETVADARSRIAARWARQWGPIKAVEDLP